ncbi:nuclear transport factor 2 family protein [Flavobacterium sp.]|uniref:nuclear transport factor 2 family protein n=1 Tax=Flavobacterium sp. TaxID=239 RepID=UPI0026335CC1|nr:nuclear transport factor 2 family protein [Flavobacterium sp.]MDD3005255.1 nuclear transport factor 2 family protein [Flavobacterium sp.]
MNQHEQIIEEFYSGFAASNAETMCSCYHPEIVFEDPVFGVLKGQDVKDMWEMLLKKSKGQLKITFANVHANGDKGFANWIAEYHFSSTQRLVVNKIHAEFEFKEGLIYRHKDSFDLYQWSKQAFGLKGVLLGWSMFFKNKIKKTALQSLRNYQSKKIEN